MLPFCPPPVSFVSPKPTPTLFLPTCNASPAASPPGGSESGRSTPSLSTYSDGKSPSSTYVAAPRHFHIPGMPRLCLLGCDALLVSSSPHIGWMSIMTRSRKLHSDGVTLKIKRHLCSFVGFHLLKRFRSSGHIARNVFEQAKRAKLRKESFESHQDVADVLLFLSSVVEGANSLIRMSNSCQELWVFIVSLLTVNSYFCLCHHPSGLCDGAVELRHEMHHF